MANFSIPDIPPKTELNKGTVDAVSGKPIAPHTGAVQFAVNNNAAEIIDGKLSVMPDGQAKADWFAIEGTAQRDFKNAASETVKVEISVPADVAQGEYGFRLLVAAVTDPDNDFAISPSTAFTVPEAGKAGGTKKSKWWLWLLLAVLALAIIGGIAWAVLKPDGPPETPPSSTTLTVPDLKGKNISELATLAAGFDLVQQPGEVGGNAPGTILAQNPEPTAPPQQPNALLKVTYDPGVEVPDLTNQTTDQAVRTLKPRRLFVEDSEVRCQTSGVTGQIVDQSPKPNTPAASKTGVKVWVRVVNVGRLQSIDCRGKFRPDLIQRFERAPGFDERIRERVAPGVRPQL